MSNDRRYEDDVADRRPARPGPALVWGLVMTAALGGAGLVVWRAETRGPETRLIATIDGGAVDRLDRDLRRLTAERDDLAQRLARVERGVGELRIATRVGADPMTTGSIERPSTVAPAAPPAAAPLFAISLGRDASLETARRRWSTLAARHPKPLAALGPRAVKTGSGGRSVELLAGPFATDAEAGRACADLAAEGVACDTTAYAGDPLDRP